MLKEFREFILRGNVIDLAIAVSSAPRSARGRRRCVDDIFTPLIAAIGGKPTSTPTFKLNDTEFTVGLFLNALFSFLTSRPSSSSSSSSR